MFIKFKQFLIYLSFILLSFDPVFSSWVEGFGPQIPSYESYGLTSSQTAAKKQYGFSGNYGLGGNLGGITLADIGYDLRQSFSHLCNEMGINLGLPLTYPSLNVPQINYWSPPPPSSPPGLYHSSYARTSDPFDQTTHSRIIHSADDIASEYKTEILLSSPSSQPTSAHSYHNQPTSAAHSYHNGYNFKQLPQYLNTKPNIFYSTGLSHSLTALPTTSSLYGPKISSYSTNILHETKGYGSSGHSSVYFTKLHTEPSKLINTPEINHLISKPLISNSFKDFDPFTYEYPGGYQTALANKYSTQLSGGYGSMLTGSYGSVITNGYHRRIGLLSDGGLKGLDFSYKK